MASAIPPRRLLSFLILLGAVVWPVRADEPVPPDPEPPAAEPVPHPEHAAGSASDLFNPSAKPLPPGQPEVPEPPHPDKPAAAPAAPGTGGALEAPIWAGVKPSDRERRKLKNASETDWGLVKSEFVWQAPERDKDSPFERGNWSTEDLFAVPLSGPLYVFGEVTMAGEYAADQAMKVTGKTGVLWRVPVAGGSAIEVRGGPTVKYNDAMKLEKGKETGTMLWEVKAKAPLLIGPVGLEYLGEAQPGNTPEDRSTLKQDLNLYLPYNDGVGKFKLGAKHRWEPGTTETRTVSGLMQLYLGIEIGR